jgi:hypothetical protein
MRIYIRCPGCGAELEGTDDRVTKKWGRHISSCEPYRKLEDARVKKKLKIDLGSEKK